MALYRMPKLPVKILCNAEPFGFGPSAAMAQIAQKLKPHIETIDYIGIGHTLDIQKAISYDAVFDISNESSEKRAEIMKSEMKKHDVYITSMDFGTLNYAKEAGCKTVFYDALTWYWHKVPPGIKDVDLYIAQDFIGVKERIQYNRSLFPKNTMVIPPLVELPYFDKEATATDVLINLGGISNPMWKYEIGAVYVQSIAKCIGQLDKKVLCIGSQRYKDIFIQYSLDDIFKTLSPQNAQSQFHNSEIVAITPGLGNIFDAALSGKPTILLPPVNDSQGQQMRLLEKNGYAEMIIDWHDIVPIPKIEYSKPQPEVLQEIEQAIEMLATHEEYQHTFAEKLKTYIQTAIHAQSKLYSLIEDFGSGGVNQAVSSILKFLS